MGRAGRLKFRLGGIWDEAKVSEREFSNATASGNGREVLVRYTSTRLDSSFSLGRGRLPSPISLELGKPLFGQRVKRSSDGNGREVKLHFCLDKVRFGGPMQKPSAVKPSKPSLF